MITSLCHPQTSAMLSFSRLAPLWLTPAPGMPLSTSMSAHSSHIENISMLEGHARRDAFALGSELTPAMGTMTGEAIGARTPYLLQLLRFCPSHSCKSLELPKLESQGGTWCLQFGQNLSSCPIAAAGPCAWGDFT